MEKLFQTCCQEIDAEAGALHELSQAIWHHPELCFEEKFAHQTLADFLEKRGFVVERHLKNVETAFRATWDNTAGSGGTSKDTKLPNVAIICEYDALPEIGHACGHNLIAQAGVAAGLGVKSAMEKCGLPKGKLTVIGTPAEEGAGGKIDLINAGVFDDVDVAMMTHPCPGNATCAITLAIQNVTVTYHGKASHAAAFPWAGVNALDAAVQAYNSLSSLRQQMKPTYRIHGIFSKGGAKPSVIPDLTEMKYIIRAEDLTELKVLRDKVHACFEGAATATGCTVDIEWDPKMYANVKSNAKLASVYDRHIGSLEPDRVVHEEIVNLYGSTDMGNVSHIVPSIHPFYGIGSGKAMNHTREFTAVAGAKEAQTPTQNQAKALALTAIEVMSDPSLLQSIKSEFLSDGKQQ